MSGTGPDRGATLLRLARRAIEEALAAGDESRTTGGEALTSDGEARPWRGGPHTASGDGPLGDGVETPEAGKGTARPRTAWLERPAACFVTVQLEGRLRGCIGSLEPRRPLIEDLRSNARAAALGDPRFPPLAADELPRTTIEVSLLGPLEEISLRGEEELAAALRPHVDGLVLAWGERRGTFLPQVWENLPDPVRFVRQLKRKAGLTEDFWSDELRAWRFGVEKWSEAALTGGD